ncbi:hypothetical protein [Actinocorallia longicatena]|uniref:hypothetical protein n=1 Tax=Actinocorallia longicatena TaxID=111803 RepID=UPI0031E17F29
MGVFVAGCAGNSPSQADSTPLPTGTAASAYTSDQLRQALLPAIATYVRAGEPDSGPYNGLKAIRNFAQLQQQVVLDKPKCAQVNQAFGDQNGTTAAPAALTTFARATGQTVTETLVAVPDDVAKEEVARRVGSLCRVFRTKVGDQWSTHQVVENTPDRHLIADGSRTVGLVTMGAEPPRGQRRPEKVAMWFVVFRSRGYLATISVYGPTATRAEAESIARSAYDQAERILPK